MTFDLKTVLPQGTDVEPCEFGHPHDVYLTLSCVGRKLLDTFVEQLPESMRSYRRLSEAGPATFFSNRIVNTLCNYTMDNDIDLTNTVMADAFRRAYVKTMQMVFPDFQPANLH